MVNCKLMGVSGDAAGSDLLKLDDAKTEMMEMREIVVMPGVRVEVRLELAC